MTARQVVVVVRDGCHLCADALAIARAVCAESAVPLSVLDVDADPALAEHSDHVPVTFVDGRRVAIWFLAEDVLRQALAQP